MLEDQKLKVRKMPGVWNNGFLKSDPKTMKKGKKQGHQDTFW